MCMCVRVDVFVRIRVYLCAYVWIRVSPWVYVRSCRAFLVVCVGVVDARVLLTRAWRSLCRAARFHLFHACGVQIPAQLRGVKRGLRNL